MKKVLPKVLKYLLLALLLYMPVFGFLNVQPLRMWDESRIAVNAHEMYTRGEYIVTYFEGHSDMWNTKPPLLVWCQVILMKLIGPDELAVRLPSAIAAFLTCALLLFVCTRYLKNFWFGFTAVMVLITCQGYVTMHGTRTGDYDALMTFFTTSGCLFFFAFSETLKTKYLYWFFVALTLGALTKGVAGLLFTPALAIFCMLQKQLLIILKNKHFYFGLLSFLVIVIGFYLVRDARDPGYIHAIRENELGGRFLQAQGENKSSFWFYYNNFIDFRLADRYLLVPCGLLLGLLSKDRAIRRLTSFCFLMCLVFFVLISSAQTRMIWYETPMYPFLAIIITVCIHYVFQLFKDLDAVNSRTTVSVLPFLFLFLILIVPYKKIFMDAYRPTESFYDHGLYDIGYYLKEATEKRRDVNGKYLVYQGYAAQNIFYLRVLQERGVKTGRLGLNDIRPGLEFIACQDTVKNYIRENFIYSEKQEKNDVFTYKVISLCK
ncbi:MAG: glycosyltransferase family 39 protein [Bacteroidota bacterium]